MNKKTYEPPIIKKVHLEIKNAILSVCHSSMINDSADIAPGCRVNNTCALGAPNP